MIVGQEYHSHTSTTCLRSFCDIYIYCTQTESFSKLPVDLQQTIKDCFKKEC